MEIGDHLPHAGDASRHAADQVVLVAVIDAHVRIGGPDQHRVDSAIALLQIIEIAIDGVLVRDRIVEIAVLHHHLRLNEAGLRPLQRGQVITRAVVADANAAFIAPVVNIGQPGVVVFGVHKL